MPWSIARCISTTPSADRQLRVVAGRDRVEAERERPLEHRGELDLLVAAQARVGRAPGGVLVHEVLDHVVVEALGQVPDVERDADDVGRPAGVVAVLDRAAAPRSRAVGRGVARQRQVDAGHVVAGLDGSGGGDGGVDAARHGGDDLHGGARPGPARRPADRRDHRIDVGWGRGVAQREAQRVPAASVGAPHREQHVRGLGDAGRAGRAGGALDAARVEEHQERVALAVGEAEVRVAGQRGSGAGRRADARPARPRSRGARGRRAARITRAACSAWCLTASSTAAARPAIAGVSMVPLRMSRSWPPP